MNCTQCKDPGADCIAKDGTRLCQTCLYERVSDERDDLQFMLEGFVAHGVHTKESRKLADTLGLREGKHTEASTCKIARKEIEKLRRERDKANEERERLRTLLYGNLGVSHEGVSALEAVAQERADAVAWMRRAADKVVQRRLMRECGCKPDDEAAKAARQCADAIEKGKHVGAAGEKK